MAKNENRKKFLGVLKVFGLAGAFSLVKKMPDVHAEVADNTAAKDISNDIIHCTSSGVFEDGQKASDLADAVNGLNKSFSDALAALKDTPIAKAFNIAGSTFTTVIAYLANIKLQSKEVRATTSVQEVTPDANCVLSNVTINPQEHTQEKVATDYTKIDLGEVHDVRYVTPKEPTGTLEITTNGTHNVKDKANVKVNISGAQLVGNYSADTTIDVSAFGATSSSQFIVKETTNVTEPIWGVQGGLGAYMRIYVRTTLPTITLNGTTLKVTAPKIRCSNDWENPGWSAFDKTFPVPYAVYYIG